MSGQETNGTAHCSSNRQSLERRKIKHCATVINIKTKQSSPHGFIVLHRLVSCIRTTLTQPTQWVTQSFVGQVVPSSGLTEGIDRSGDSTQASRHNYCCEL